MGRAGETAIPAALRSYIDTAARKLKQGPQVREGPVINEAQEFFYDQERLPRPVWIPILVKAGRRSYAEKTESMKSECGCPWRGKGPRLEIC